MNEAEFRDYWTRSGKTDSDHVLREGVDVFRIAASEIQPFLEGAKTVLDLGCGAGEVFEHLRLDRAGYLGVDFSRSMLDAFAAKHPGVRLEQGEATTFTTREKFDLVIVNNVIQYCAPWMTLACIQTCADALAPGGKIFLGNIPHRSHRVAYYRGTYQPSPPVGFEHLVRSVYAVLFVAVNRHDRIGYWYTPDEIERFAKPLGLECSTFAGTLYPYRFTAILKKGIT